MKFKFKSDMLNQYVQMKKELDDRKVLSVRDIAEDHVKEDCGGAIPTIEDWMQNMTPQSWMLGKGAKIICP